MLYLNFSKAYGYQNWQDGVFSWEAVIYKMTWLFDHMVIWGHVTNKKRYISTSIKPVATRLYWKAYGKYLPTTKLHVLSIKGSYDMKQRYIFTLVGPMFTKPDRMMAYEKGSPPTIFKWHISHLTNKNCCVYFHKPYGNQIW